MKKIPSSDNISKEIEDNLYNGKAGEKDYIKYLNFIVMLIILIIFSQDD